MKANSRAAGRCLLPAVSIVIIGAVFQFLIMMRAEDRESLQISGLEEVLARERASAADADAPSGIATHFPARIAVPLENSVAGVHGEITGVITNPDRQPLAGVLLTLQIISSSNIELISSARSSSDGSWSLQLPLDAAGRGAAAITAEHEEYSTTSLLIPDPPGCSRRQLGMFMMPAAVTWRIQIVNSRDQPVAGACVQPGDPFYRAAGLHFRARGPAFFADETGIVIITGFGPCTLPLQISAPGFPAIQTEIIYNERQRRGLTPLPIVLEFSDSTAETKPALRCTTRTSPCCIGPSDMEEPDRSGNPFSGMNVNITFPPETTASSCRMIPLDSQGAASMDSGEDWMDAGIYYKTRALLGQVWCSALESIPWTVSQYEHCKWIDIETPAGLRVRRAAAQDEETNITLSHPGNTLDINIPHAAALRGIVKMRGLVPAVPMRVTIESLSTPTPPMSIFTNPDGSFEFPAMDPGPTLIRCAEFRDVTSVQILAVGYHNNRGIATALKVIEPGPGETLNITIDAQPPETFEPEDIK